MSTCANVYLPYFVLRAAPYVDIDMNPVRYGQIYI